MSPVPTNPKVYHITHIDNLPAMLRTGCIWSDREMIDQKLAPKTIGMSEIKARRLGLPVKCHPGLMVGECVPFYFCPRSIMLYILHRGNRVQVQYGGGQGPILHLEADLNRCVEWAERNATSWAFSRQNAATRIAQFFDSVDNLDRIDWDAVSSNNFSDPQTKDGKQAEFLLERRFPWHLVERIGVHSTSTRDRVENALCDEADPPRVEILPGWYF